MITFVEQTNNTFHGSIRALEPGLSALWIAKVRPCCGQGGKVFDVGSHFGYYALLANAMGCSFEAFEPVPTFRSVLQFNTMVNHARGNVHPYALGVGTNPLKMAVPTTGILGLAHVTAMDNPDGISVEQRRLDEFLKVGGPQDICMLKIDVEGYEPTVLKSVEDAIRSRSIKHIMLEFSPGMRTDGLLDMLQMFYEAGYTAHEVNWGEAKQHQTINAINARDMLSPASRVDISNVVSQQAFVDRVRPQINTNLWLEFD
jgi:FkbM family methyltransferase